MGMMFGKLFGANPSYETAKKWRRRTLKDSNEENRAKKLKTLWLVSFLFVMICSHIYEFFFQPSSASPFPSVQSAVLAGMILLYFYPLTIAMGRAAKQAGRKKLLAFSRIMMVYFSLGGFAVILYLVLILIK